MLSGDRLIALSCHYHGPSRALLTFSPGPASSRGPSLALCAASGTAMAEEPRNQRAEEAFDVGSRQYLVQNYAAAEASFALAVRLQPNDVKYHYCLGDARMMQKKLETAELAFAVAAKLGHPDAGIHLKVVCKDRERRRAEEAYQAGRRWYCSKSYALAEASFAEAARLQPSDRWYHYALGRARYEQKKWAAAEASFDPKMLQKKLEAAVSAFTEAERAAAEEGHRGRPAMLRHPAAGPGCPGAAPGEDLAGVPVRRPDGH
ncbi:hypothetical protein AK812_SmicGene20185 [Symbiodinium microadriaticum]|uniref:Uncharacterized protein n=1 Tax=Symbiodinium microadriaticum TaxID=2951 RepID=A0A1Q9DQM2_SYMMI|nr:hypothetical protein AK812_SmicGene20185 [Symbiodinium microadriaticum]